MSRGETTLLLVLVIVAVLALGGGAYLVNRSTTRATVREALRLRARLAGVSEDWLEALGETETKLGAAGLVNDTGNDAVRGGSYGPTQISARTARAWGYDGPMQALAEDMDLAAKLTADMVAAGFAELTPTSVLRSNPDAPYRPVRYGPPSTFEDMLSVWNAGRPAAQLGAASDTLLKYIPRGQGYLASIESAAAGEETS